MEIDFHGHYPRDVIDTGILHRIVQQAWEMSEPQISFIHGHGRNRGISPGFVNTNTGRFGLAVRSALRNSPELRSYVVRSTLDCRNPGVTCVQLRRNSEPSRTQLDPELQI
jgi:hypothetical protein